MRVATVGELRKILEGRGENDYIVIETINDHGDAEDLYPMYVDVIGGIQLEDGTEISEVRFCQMDQKFFNI